MFSERMNNKGNNHQGNNDNSWGGQNVRKSYDNYYNNNRGDFQQNDGGNKIEQRMQNMRLDSGSHSSSGGGKTATEHKEQGPKKMTWATIASQPAKPQISTASTTVKKKGFGPPPPMIPGKHNMELTDGWDTPKNGPLVPPSPPIIQAPQPELIEKQNNSNFEGQPAWPTPGQAQNQAPASAGGNYPATQQQQPPHQQQQHQNNNSRGGNGGGYNSSMNSNNSNNNNNQNNYQGHSGGRQYNQNSSSGQHQQYNSSSSSSSHHYNDFQKPYHQHPHQMPTAPPQNHQPSAPITRSAPPPAAPPVFTAPDPSEDSILEQLRVKNQYNPSDLDLSLVDNARFFVIKSYSEDDIHRSIKYEIWCSTEHGNQRLDQAFRESEKETGVIYLFFSVNSSGHFCGVAQMITPVDYNSNSSVWSQDKWKGSFRVKWLYVKDVPNTQLRHIRLENNENKPVTNSRDTQEVPNGHGIQMMKIIHSFKHTTSIFDDFTHYEKRQEEEDSRKHESHDAYQKPMTLPPSHHSTHNRENMNRQQQYDNNGGGRSFDRDRDYNNGSSGGGYNNGSSYNKYGGGNSGYNNDYKPSFNGRGGYNNKRNDFRNDRNGDQQQSGSGGGFYRAKPEYQQNDDFGGNRGGYRSDRGSGSRGRGSFRPHMSHNDNN